MAVERVQRNEIMLAVQFKLHDSADHGTIRGWINAPPLIDLSDTLDDGDWIIKANTGQVYRITNETYRADFVRALTSID
jgi:hypothetical protein